MKSIRKRGRFGLYTVWLERERKSFLLIRQGISVIMGPLGNGFPMEEKKAFLIGGGIGIPPML